MKQALLALAATAAIAISAPAAAAVIVSLHPASQTVDVGNTIAVDVKISGLGTGQGREILSSFDLSVLYNSTLATWQSTGFFGAEFGSPDDYFSAIPGLNDVGVIGGSWLNDDNLALVQTEDSFTFLTFTWKAETDGALFLKFGADPDFERNVVGLNARSLDAQFLGACVAIGTGNCDIVPVPEPASYGLAGLALLGCGLATTRRRRAGAPAAV